IALERPSTGRIPRSRIAETARVHGPAMEWANRVFPYDRGVTAPVIAAHLYAYPAAPDAVEKFAEQYVARTAASPNDPAIVLRRFMERMSSLRSEARTIALATLRCLQAYERGQTIGRLSVDDRGLTYFAEKLAAKGL